MNNPITEERVPLASRLWVSAADAATAMLNTFVVNIGITYYFTSYRGMDPAQAGIVWLLFGIWNAVNDPLFGYISDRTRNALGRRLPYIRYGAPLIGLSFILVWLNPGGVRASQSLLFTQMLLVLFAFDALYTAIATSVYVMPFEMAVSNKARGSILLWKLIFNIFPMAVPLVLWGILKPEPGADSTLFQGVMAGFGVAMAAIIFFSTWFYRENHYQRGEAQPPFVQAVLDCFRNRSFVVFEVLSFTIIYVQTSLMLGLNYYLGEIRIPAMAFYAALGAGIVSGVVLFVNVRERWGVRRSMLFMTAVFSAGCFVMLALGRELVPVLAAAFCFGIGFSGGMYLIPMMNGDVVDMDEHRTGLRREGMYAGVNSFITKPAISFANSAFLWFLAAYGYNFNGATGTQGFSAQTGILMGWVLVPGILLAISFASLFLYPLAGTEWDAIKHRLTVIHAEKEKRALAERGFAGTSEGSLANEELDPA